jgi:hypothetical protein
MPSWADDGLVDDPEIRLTQLLIQGDLVGMFFACPNRSPVEVGDVEGCCAAMFRRGVGGDFGDEAAVDQGHLGSLLSARTLSRA